MNQGKDKGWLTFEEVESYRDPYKNRTFEQTQAFQLNKEQQHAVERIVEAGQQEKSHTFY